VWFYVKIPRQQYGTDSARNGLNVLEGIDPLMSLRAITVASEYERSCRTCQSFARRRGITVMGGFEPGRHEMLVEQNADVPMRDGAILHANVYRPNADGRFPVLMTFGPYGKDVPLREFMQEAWDRLNTTYPEILAASSCKHLVFERPDPEMWVPDGYIVINVDSRGAGKSPGRLDPNSPTEFRDFYDAIEWAGTQPWSSGKVGLLGISYYAAGQWFVAAMRPPHLAAILPWQGTYDFYRDRTRQDGIYASGFLKRWWNRSVLRNQHGNPDTDCRDIYTGERVTGPANLSQAELAAKRADYLGDVLAHPLNDSFYHERTPDLSKIDYPALVIANWGGLGLTCVGRFGAIWESPHAKNG